MVILSGHTKYIELVRKSCENISNVKANPLILRNISSYFIFYCAQNSRVKRRMQSLSNRKRKHMLVLAGIQPVRCVGKVTQIPSRGRAASNG